MTPSLRQAMGASFGALALVAIAVTALLAGREAEQLARANEIEELRVLSDNLADQLDKGMFERWRDIRVAAAMPSMRDPDLPVAVRRAILRQLHDTYPDYALVGFIEPGGRVIADSRSLTEGADASSRVIFQHGRERPAVEDVHDAIILAGLLPRRPDGFPSRFVDFAAPVIGDDDMLVGVVAAHLNWSWAEDIARRFREIVGRSRRAEALIVATDGTILLGPRSLMSSALPAAASAKGAAVWPDGLAYLSVTALTHGYRDYPGLGWSVVVRQPAEVLSARARPLHWSYLQPALLTVLLATLVGWLLAGWIARPLVALAGNAERAHDLGENVAFPIEAITAPYCEARTLAGSLGRLVNGLREGTISSALLVREADHRLKNSVMTVASILSLQARRTNDPATRAAFGDAAARVRTVAEVHKALYSADGPPGVTVDLCLMLHDLCHQHAHTALRPGLELEYVPHGPVFIEGRRAMPIGLLVAELVTNAGKHAFPAERTGSVHVSLKETDGSLELVVEDDGVGMVEVASTVENGLGKTLIARLARQVSGQFSITSVPGHGTRAVLRFRP